MKDIFGFDKSLKNPRIITAAFDGDDFTTDFGVNRSDYDRELDFARKLFAFTCHAFDGITSINNHYVNFKDSAGLQ